MKYLLLILMLLVTSPCLAVNRWIDIASGNDANDGLSEGAPKLTFSDTFNDYACSGDTIIVWGSKSGSQNIIPGADDDGAEDARTVFISKNAYQGNWQRAVTDTTLIWDANYRCNNVSVITLIDRDFIDFIGFNFRCDGDPGFDYLCVFRGADSVSFYQCRFESVLNQGKIDFFLHQTTANIGINFNNCVMWSSSATANVIYNLVANTEVLFTNCTFYVNTDRILTSSAALKTNFKNCIFQNNSPTSTNYFIRLTTVTTTPDFDYNLWYAPNLSDNPWRLVSTNYTTFGAWQTAMQVLDASNEVNSSYGDQSLQYVATTCVPSSFTDGEDLGFGLKIGWFQPEVVSNQQIIIIE